jgi:uncharacterized membrane protein YeaQ/YmgE (transglycosylase-associated protein family)
MNVFLWILAGGLAGWIACTALRLNVSRGLVISAIIGGAGAFFGGHVLAPIFGAHAGEAGAFSPFALLVAVASAIGCLSLSDMMYERFGF